MEEIIMKKILALTLAAMLAATALTGCTGGNGNSENKDQIDVGKVSGVTLKSEATEEESRAALGNVEIAITDAKVVEYNGEDVAIVEFTYKNNGESEAPFTGVVKDTASQDEHTLTPTVIDNVDGVDMLALTENVAPGHQISVQKAYRLRDKTNDLVVEVRQIETNGNAAPKFVTKTFSFN